MDRTLGFPSAIPSGIPSADIEIGAWSSPWVRVLPLWRYLIVGGALFLMLTAAVAVRGDVQRTMKELDRNESLRREARINNERLRLEVASRRRAVAMEQVAGSLALGPEASLVHLKAVQ